jgi:RNA polymerase sigma factor (sigma-70 family)
LGSPPVALVPATCDDPLMTNDISAALETMVSRFAVMVRSVGTRHRLSDADLDEVIQEVRIRLWKSCTTSEQIRGLGTSYVYRTATSAALDMLRRRRAHGGDRSDSVESMASVLPDVTAGPAESVEAGELGERIMTAIETIPASRRAVVRMHLNGYEREEIAALLGWSEAKTRNLLYRGLADLRARLTDQGIPERT